MGKGVTYKSSVIEMDSNPIKTALNVCKSLIAKQVYAVVVSQPPAGDLSPAAVSYTSGFYHIPVIGISSRDSAFSDKVSRPARSKPWLKNRTSSPSVRVVHSPNILSSSLSLNTTRLRILDTGSQFFFLRIFQLRSRLPRSYIINSNCPLLI